MRVAAYVDSSEFVERSTSQNVLDFHARIAFIGPEDVGGALYAGHQGQENVALHGVLPPS